ncbi:putative Zn-binding protein involved in type VI secretion [Sphingobium xanthum]|uniref:PAAR domain-containing protein n=1 Tax=Sphingobium xanthum TaxID=1387165 RepID=UPI001C8B6257|nr:PAAR domain-containing protein [Sphingobium xanthum]
MGKPIARADDQVIAVDTHIVMVPAVAPIPTPLPHMFSGKLDGGLSTSVKANGRAVATLGSTATNQPAHIPTPPGVSFQKPPSNNGTVMLGSANVLVQGKPVARAGDTALTCNDPADMPVGKIVAAGTVMVGG